MRGDEPWAGGGVIAPSMCGLGSGMLCAGGGEAEGVEEGEGDSDDCFQAMMSASWMRGFVLMS